jgi:hypothetical protein
MKKYILLSFGISLIISNILTIRSQKESKLSKENKAMI